MLIWHFSPLKPIIAHNSEQHNTISLFSLKNSCPCRDLNPEPPRYQVDMLPNELSWLGFPRYFVGLGHWVSCFLWSLEIFTRCFPKPKRRTRFARKMGINLATEKCIFKFAEKKLCHSSFCSKINSKSLNNTYLNIIKILSAAVVERSNSSCNQIVDEEGRWFEPRRSLI